MLSDCCGVLIYRGDICTRCKEHCEPMEDSDDGYDAARDAYLTGEGPAVTHKQKAEVDAWNEECRRNGW
jgi:hypothetical protein